KGWTRQEDPSGWIVLTPPQELSFGNPRVFVATRKIEGSHWAAHRALLKDLVKQAKWEGSYTLPATSAPGPFIASEVTSTTDARTIKLYTAVSAGDRLEAVAVSPTGGGEFTTAFLPILERTTLQNPAEKPKRPVVVE